MRLHASFLMIALASCWAQKGSAPSGFYPFNYHGDTFAGKVVSTTEDEIVLESEHKAKKVVFTGKIEAPCTAPTKKGPTKQLSLRQIPVGTVLTAYYNTESYTQGDTKKNFNSVLAIRFDELNWKKLDDPSRPVIPCSKPSPGMNAH